MSSHILPKRVYYTIFAILLFCTYLTVQIAFLDLGVLNTVAAPFVVRTMRWATGSVNSVRARAVYR